MAEKRRKFFRKVKERDERLARIAASTPPPQTLEGQLQRLRDRNRAIESGVERDTGDTFERLDDGAEDELNEEVAIVVAAEPAMKPGHRQPAPAQQTKVGDVPWWAKTKPGEMTATAEAERERMEKSWVAKSVHGRINEV